MDWYGIVQAILHNRRKLSARDPNRAYTKFDEGPVTPSRGPPFAIGQLQGGICLRRYSRWKNA
jgi:hypothetical protein